MTPEQLRAVAVVGDLVDLGSEPTDGAKRGQWLEERRGLVMLLADLADRDAALLRRAAYGPASTITAAATALLLEAAKECN